MNTRMNDNTVELSDAHEQVIWDMYIQIQKEEKEAMAELNEELAIRKFEREDTVEVPDMAGLIEEAHFGLSFDEWMAKQQEVLNRTDEAVKEAERVLLCVEKNQHHSAE